MSLCISPQSVWRGLDWIVYMFVCLEHVTTSWGLLLLYLHEDCMPLCGKTERDGVHLQMLHVGGRGRSGRIGHAHSSPLSWGINFCMTTENNSAHVKPVEYAQNNSYGLPFLNEIVSWFIWRRFISCRIYIASNERVITEWRRAWFKTVVA